MNNTQSNKSIYIFYLYFSFSLVLLLSRSSFVLLHCRVANLEALGVIRST